MFVLLASTAGAIPAAMSVASHLEPGEPVEFSLPDQHGKLHRLSDHRERWVVVNFWATWCGPCVREMPALQAFSEQHQDVSVIGINFEQITQEQLRAAVTELDIDYLVVQVGDTPLLPFEPLKGLPSTFLVSPNGRLVYRRIGEIATPELFEALEEARSRHAAR